MKNDAYRPGDYYVICDRTGFKVLRSQCRRTWDGLIVRKESWEPRHPQDLIRARQDRQAVPDPRSEAEDTFLEDNEVTADDL